jgi:Flp pilus assembly protein CpaB
MFNSIAARFSNSRSGAVLLGVAAAVLAAILLLVYLNRYRNSVKADNATSPVLVAKALIPKGTSGTIIGTQQLYQGAEFKRSEIKGGAIADPTYLVGRIAIADILPGEQLLTSDFSSGTTSAINTKITGPQRAISVNIDNVHGSLSLIKPGDHIDIYVGLGARGNNGQSLVKLFKANVLVLAVPGESSSSANINGNTGPSGNMTLRIDNQKDAAAFAYAADNTQLWFVIRPASGAKPTTPQTATVTSLLGR